MPSKALSSSPSVTKNKITIKISYRLAEGEKIDHYSQVSYLDHFHG
jgi:hypothetical protein